MMIFSYLMIGLIVGSVAGMLGIGGGVLLVPLLMWIFPHFDQRRAIGITLCVLALPVGLLPALQNYQRGFLKTEDLHAALFIAPSFLLGACLGAYMMPIIPKEALRIFFGLMLVYIGVSYVFGSDHKTAAAYTGLVSVAISTVAYFALRALGRSYQPRKLEKEIGRFEKQNPQEPDYYI